MIELIGSDWVSPFGEHFLVVCRIVCAVSITLFTITFLKVSVFAMYRIILLFCLARH